MEEEQKGMSAEEYVDLVANKVFAAQKEANDEINLEALRDNFAASALNALITGSIGCKDLACRTAYEFADEMLLAREK